MAGSRTVSEVVVVVLLRAQSSSSKLLGVVEGGLCSGGREVHERVLSMTGFNIEPVFYAKAYTPCRGIELSVRAQLLVELLKLSRVHVLLRCVVVCGVHLLESFAHRNNILELFGEATILESVVHAVHNTNKGDSTKDDVEHGSSFQSRVFNIL
nr:MAG TPA: hypothetical protein [Caudoviricetes sp.]